MEISLGESSKLLLLTKRYFGDINKIVLNIFTFICHPELRCDASSNKISYELISCAYLVPLKCFEIFNRK